MLGQTVRGNGPQRLNGPWISLRLLPVVVAGSMARAFPPVDSSIRQFLGHSIASSCIQGRVVGAPDRHGYFPETRVHTTQLT